MRNNNYVVTTTLPPEFGGRTTALLQRTKFLMETFNEPFTLISTNYHPEYDQIYRAYIEKQYVPPNTQFLNIYDFFANRTYHHKRAKKHPVKIKKHEIQEVKKKKNKDSRIFRYFQNGEYVRYRKYDRETGALIFEDFMDIYTRKRKERLLYNRFGHLHKKLIFRRGTTQILEELFYNDKGKVYLTKSYSAHGDGELARILLFYEEKIREFKDEQAFFKFAFNRILKGNSTTFSDARLLDKPLLECKVETKKVFVLHSNHAPKGKLRASYEYLFEHNDQADCIVVLTEEQAEDLVEAGVKREKIVVIPHTVRDKLPVDELSNERKKEFVFIGRLAGEKQIDHIIKAFGKIAGAHPDWSLSLYGTGELDALLQECINENGLAEQVMLKGFTNDPQAVFRQAACSVITSKFEGFGLVIMESLHNGCPVISYDFKYGPKDLIENGVNGLIVEKNNIDALAEAMERFIKEPLQNVKLDDDFYLEANLKKWENVFLQ